MIYRFAKDTIDEVAGRYGYNCIDFQENIGMVSYSDGASRINVYLTKMTVATCINHPKKGATQLFRRDVTLSQLNEIFDYPRIHTGRGYYKRKSK